MTDQPSGSPRSGAERDARGENLFERFFPGPAPKDPRVAARLDALARAAERRSAAERQRAEGRSDRTRSGAVGQRRSGPASPSATAEATATAEDVDRIVEALHDQTDVLRSLLDADVAVRDDARSTAQNSRTFAIAGIVIAFFTLVATVVTVVDALLS